MQVKNLAIKKETRKTNMKQEKKNSLFLTKKKTKMTQVNNFSQSYTPESSLTSIIPLYDFDGKSLSFEVVDCLIKNEIEKRGSKEVIVVFYGTLKCVQGCDLSYLTYLNRAKMIACLDDETLVPTLNSLGLNVEFISEGTYTAKTSLVLGFLNKEKIIEKDKDKYPYLYTSETKTYLTPKMVAYPNVLFATQPIWGLGDCKMNSEDYVGSKGLNRIIRKGGSSLKCVFAPFFQPEQYRVIKFNVDNYMYETSKYYIHPYSMKNKKNNHTVISLVRKDKTYIWETSVHVSRTKTEQEVEKPISVA